MAKNTEHDYGHVEGTLEEEIIPGGYNRQREDSKLNRILAMLKALWRKR